MSQELIYGELRFDRELVFALTPDHSKLKFSKYERALLLNFTNNPGKLQSREKLLDVISALGSDSIDRNIDYLVSRLRRKLGDNAKTPQYIVTQYGEGYIWIAIQKAAMPVAIPKAAYITIGPVYGLAKAREASAQAVMVIDAMTLRLRERLGGLGTIELFSANTADSHGRGRADFSLGVSFITAAGNVTCNMVLIHPQTGRVLGSHRLALQFTDTEITMTENLNAMAAAIVDDIHQAQVFRAIEEPSLSSDPISVGLYKAAQLFEPGAGNNAKVEDKLRDRLREYPDDHYCAILLANNLGSQLFAGNFDRMEERTQEIESLIFENMFAVQHNALYLSSIAERLLDLGHVELSETLAERALDIGPSYAACYMVLGRIHIYNGNIEEGLGYYQHSLEMAEYGSAFYRLLQTLRAIALMATNQHDKLREVALTILEHEPNLLNKPIVHAMLLAGVEEKLPLHVRTVLRILPVKAARHFLKILYYIAERNCGDEFHRANVLRGMANVLIDIHGDKVIPSWIRQGIPSLMLEFGGDQKLRPTVAP